MLGQVIRLLYLLILLGIPYQISADQSQLKEEIIEYLQKSLENQFTGRIEINVASLDHRLKLKHCNAPLSFTTPTHYQLSTRVTIKVECPSPKAWAIYVPANIKVYREVIATVRPLSRNDIITLDDIGFQETNIALLNQGYYDDLEEVIGKLTKQSLKAGHVLSPKNLTKPKVILRGDLVTILVSSEGLKVHMQGVAMQSGALGDSIKIKNTSSGRIINGVIVDQGVVKVFL